MQKRVQLLMVILVVFGFGLAFAGHARADTAIFIKVQLWNDTNRNGLKDAGESWSGSGIRTEGAFVDEPGWASIPCGQESFEYDVVFTGANGFAYYKDGLPLNNTYCIDDFKVQGKCMYILARVKSPPATLSPGSTTTRFTRWGSTLAFDLPRRTKLTATVENAITWSKLFVSKGELADAQRSLGQVAGTPGQIPTARVDSGTGRGKL